MWRTPGKPARAPVPALCPARGSHTPLTCTRLCGFACLHFVLRVCTLSCAWLTHASAWFCVPALCLRLSSSLRACTSYARGGQPLPGANRSARGLHFVCAWLTHASVWFCVPALRPALRVVRAWRNCSKKRVFCMRQVRRLPRCSQEDRRQARAPSVRQGIPVRALMDKSRIYNRENILSVRSRSCWSRRFRTCNGHCNYCSNNVLGDNSR